MGKKKTETEAAPKPEPAAKEEEEEDPPIVKKLKVVDDEYLKLEREYQKEVQLLQAKYMEKQAPFLAERSSILQDKDLAEDADETTGTPAIKGFWLQALKHHPAIDEQVEDWDEPVLEYCSDVTYEYRDNDDYDKGFVIKFHFKENPYFENKILTKEYVLEEGSPYTGEQSATSITACPIDWKPGKNVTVAVVAKKSKGAKKNKQKGKDKEEPRASFFRTFFRTLEKGKPIPEGTDLEDMLEEDDEGDEEQMMEYLLDNDLEAGCALRDTLIPYAVRWYTGECAPEGDDLDEEGEEEEEGETEDEDDEDDDDDVAPKKKGKAGAGKPKEECKQQ